ncbi:MAG TPA: hypothetical protein VIF62_29820 [Labilithrix sp.]
MTKNTTFLTCALALAATASCYAAPALTYDDASNGAPPSQDAGDAASAAPAADSDARAPDPDAGVPHDAAAPDAADAGDASRDAAPVTVTCTSATYWDTTGAASELMHPGATCIACHSANAAPAYTLAGTVYPTMHEPDDCNGVDGTLNGMTILVIDATGATHTIPVDASGNFKRVTSIPMPYRASVVSGSNVREMKSAQFDGDCNGCHSALGNRSPGRIMAP